MSEREGREVAKAVILVLTVMLGAFPGAVAQTNSAGAKPQDRDTLLKVKPNIAGQRNGVFLEPDPMDFAEHPGYTSLFDGKTLADGAVYQACGASRMGRL